MTNDQADELLKNNDWAKWSDARELLMEAAHMGAMDERKNLDAKLRRLAIVEEQREALLDALWVCMEHNLLHYGESHNTVIQARAAIAAATKV